MFSALAHGTKSAVDSVLPALAVFTPALGAVAVAVAGKREKARDLIACGWAALALVICVLMFPSVMVQGKTLLSREPLFFGDFSISADRLGLVFALAATLLWLVATLYARDYIKHEGRRTRYQVFSLLAESAVLGVFLSGDFFVFFVFFELIALFAYMLVIHNQEPASLEAGSKLILMSIFGGLCLLFGILLYLVYARTIGFNAIPGSPYLSGSACFIVAAFMLVGMGVKAGMVPVHVWLPLAHPAAPSPASALLSGIMIKAGVFGIMRLIGTFSLAAGEGATAAVSRVPQVSAVEHAGAGLGNLETLGWVIVVLGVITMLVGMSLALVQDNLKRLLAFSSISQIGYIIVGLGCGAFLGGEGAMGLSGGIYHSVNHSMFKGLLFLAAGAVIFSVEEADMRKLGGLWKKMPATTAVACVAALGIIGVPLFSGFASKTLLHHSILEAAHAGGAWMRLVDVMFLIAAAGTTCYIIKFIYLTFFKPPAQDAPVLRRRVSIGMECAMGVLAAGVLFFGVFPSLIMREIVVPALSAFGFLEPAAVHHMLELQFFTLANIVAILPALGIGIAAFLVGLRWDLFRFRLPRYLGIDYYYDKLGAGFLLTCHTGASVYARLKEREVAGIRGAAAELARGFNSLRSGYRQSVNSIADAARGTPSKIASTGAWLSMQSASRDVAFGIVILAAVVAVVVLVSVL